MSELRLAQGLRFVDLYEPAGLAAIDRHFLAALRASDEGLAGRLLAARAEPGALDQKAESQLILDLAGHVEDFIGELFGIQSELKELQGRLASERGMIFNAADTASFRAKLGGAFYGRWREQFGSTAWSLLESEVGRLG